MTNPVQLLAELTDLRARLGYELDDAAVVRAAAVLIDVSSLVAEEVDTTPWIDESGALNSDLVPGVVRTVVLRVAERAMRNPEGVSAESSGDYSYQRKGAEPGVALTAADVRTLRRSVQKAGLWSMPTTRGDDYVFPGYATGPWND